MHKNLKSKSSDNLISEKVKCSYELLHERFIFQVTTG